MPLIKVDHGLLLIRSSNQGQLPNDPKALFGGRDKKSSKQAFRIMEEDLDNCFLEADGRVNQQLF